MEPVLVSTLSTIALAVAAAFGLLAAFALFRLESLERGMWIAAQALMDGAYFEPEEASRLKTLLGRQHYAAFLDAVMAALANWRRRLRADYPGKDSPHTTPWSDGEVRIDNLRWGIDVSRRMKRRLQFALWPSVITVFYSIAGIPLAHVIPCGALAWCAIGLGLILLLGCLTSYVRLIAGSVGRN